MFKKCLWSVLVAGVLSVALPAQASGWNWFGSNEPAHLPDIRLQSGVMMPMAKPLHLQDVHFIDQDGQAFGEANFKNHWTLVFFGFTYCPMLCPTTMAELNNAYLQWQKQALTPLPQVVFISIDPARDSQGALKTFVSAFNPHFMGLRMVDEKSLAAFARQLDASYEKIKGSGKDKDDKGQYTLTHTGDIAVINPQGELVALLTMPHLDKNIATDYALIIKKLA